MLVSAYQFLSAASQTITDKPRVDLYPKGDMIVIRAVWGTGCVCVHGIHMSDLVRIKMNDEDIMLYFVEKCNREYAHYMETRQKTPPPAQPISPMDDISKMYVDHLVTDLQKRSVFEIVVFLSKYCGWDRIKRYMDDHINNLARRKDETQRDQTQV